MMMMKMRLEKKIHQANREVQGERREARIMESCKIMLGLFDIVHNE
jgi:hypothetical protein